MSLFTSRIKKELEIIQSSDSPGVSCWLVSEDNLHIFEAELDGPEDSPYQNGRFKLHIELSSRYPFEPPIIQFQTPIYHPNIDHCGRICLDLLKMPPKGSWKPSLNIITVLMSIRLLMADPNPDDPLVIDIAQLYSMNRGLFNEKAKQQTLEHAIPKKTPFIETMSPKQPMIHSPKQPTIHSVKQPTIHSISEEKQPLKNIPTKRPISEKFTKLSKRKT